MTSNSTLGVVRIVRLFRRAAGILIAVIGVIALVVGIVLSLSQTWPKVTGTVQSCQTSTTRDVTRNGSRPGSRQVHQNCVVSWSYQGKEQQSTLDLGSQPRYASETVKLRVHGGTAVVATSPWIGVVTLAVGVILLVVGVVVALRTRRRSTA